MIGDVELFCRERRRHAPNAPFVAITGTNGKSTTTALIAHLMKVAGYDTQMGGNIGTAILSLEPPRMGRVHVIEMSSYQIDLAPSLDPSVGILINISEDHIDRHGTLEHYAAVKERLVAGVQQGRHRDHVGVDDIWSRNIADRLDRAGKRVVRISVKNPLPDGLYVEHETIVRAHGAARSEGRASRRHRLAARPAQCAERRVRRGLRTGDGHRHRRVAERPAQLPGLAHRMEQVGRRGHVLFVNDSKGTNADAAAHALSSFADIYWIAGGKPKAGGITGLSEYFPRIRKAYLIGEAAAEFAGTLGERVPHEMSGTLDVAIASAARDAEASGPRGRRRAAVAGLRLVRPVPQFRNPRHGLPRHLSRRSRRQAGGDRRANSGDLPGIGPRLC